MLPDEDCVVPDRIRRVLEAHARDEVAPHVVRAFLQDGVLGSPDFWKLLGKMVQRGLLEEDVLQTVRRALETPDG